ncbi:MAG: carboxymuconolactone decarboxylase family protein [Gammaproteobacteria bacterium]|jgi:AhpD family alkylhydroperoxidase
MTDQTYASMRRRITKANAGLRNGQPDIFTGFNLMHQQAMCEGVLEPKTKELVAVALSVASRCDPCIAFHVPAAMRLGATREEIMEILSVTVLMGGGPSLMYAAHVMEVVEEELASGRS